MIDFDLHIRDPQQQTYNTAFVYNRVLTKTLSLEIVVINKTYTWLKVAFSISSSPYIILGLFKFVICIKIK